MNPESHKEVGPGIPSSRSEVGTRLAHLVVGLGGNKVAAEIAGVTTKTITEWKSGAARVPLEGAARLCASAGVSVDWLVTGSTPPVKSGVDQELLQMIIDELERFREVRNLQWDAATKARLIGLGYDMMTSERARGIEPTAESLQYLMKAAS